jgi:mono/diheme cytochrome c family protein
MFICLAVALSGSTRASAQSDPLSTGHQLAATYCASCHSIKRTGESPLPQAPHFRDLHLRYDVEGLSEALVEGIATAHPEMPEFEFGPYEAAAIVSYLKSLEKPAPGNQQ